MSIEIDITRRIEWLNRRIGLTNSDKEYVRLQMQELVLEALKQAKNNEVLDLVSKPLLPEGVTINSATSKEGFNFTDYEYREWLKSDIDNLDDFLEQELC